MTERIRVTIPDFGPSMTKQADAGETDVTRIVNRYLEYGDPAILNVRQARAFFGDFTNGLDLHRAMDALAQAQQGFEALPAPVRDYCRNDPGVFLDLVDDPERRDELVKLGMLDPPDPVPAPEPAPPVEAAPEAPANPEPL